LSEGWSWLNTARSVSTAHKLDGQAAQTGLQQTMFSQIMAFHRDGKVRPAVKCNLLWQTLHKYS